jgi:hypothetical protein
VDLTKQQFTFALQFFETVPQFRFQPLAAAMFAGIRSRDVTLRCALPPENGAFGLWHSAYCIK